MKNIKLILLIFTLAILLTGCDSGVEEVMTYTGLDEEEIIAIYKEAEEAYNAGEYEAAMDGYDMISGYKDAESKKTSARQKYIEEILVYVQELQASESYTEALELIYEAEEIAGKDSALSDKTVELKAAYKTQAVALADEYTASGDFDAAISALEAIEEVVGSDAEISAKVINTEKQKYDTEKENLFAIADEYILSNDYDSALAALKQLESSKTVDAEVKAKVSKIEEDKINYNRDTAFELADGYVEKNNYESAVAVLAELKNIIGKDSQTDAKISEINKLEIAFFRQNLMDDIEAFEKNVKTTEGYADMIALISKELATIGNDTEISGILSKYQNTYRDNILKEAATAFDKDGYAKAIEKIKEGMENLPDVAEFTQALENYQQYVPVFLNDLKVIGSNGWKIFEEYYDPLDNKYTNILTGENNRDSSYYYAEYYIGKNYDIFSGILIPTDRIRTDGKMVFKVYADGNLIYSSDTFTRKSSSQNFSIDISEYDYLKITTYYLSSDYAYSLMLDEAYVSRIAD